MSWASRLHKLKCNEQLQPDNLEPVFISGPIILCDEILQALNLKHTWADISNISIGRLVQQYNGDFKKILDFMRNNRYESKIYRHCDIDLFLIQLSEKYLKLFTNTTLVAAMANNNISTTTAAAINNNKINMKFINNENTNNMASLVQIPLTESLENFNILRLNEQNLNEIYDECSRLIYGCDSYTLKTVFIIDLSLKYFNAHYKCFECQHESKYTLNEMYTLNKFLLYCSATLALVAKKHLFPFIDFIVICDFEMLNISSTSSSSLCYCKTLLKCLQLKLKNLNITTQTTINYDINDVIKLIMDLHIIKSDIDLELM